MTGHAQTAYRPFPRAALYGAALLIGMTFLAAGLGRIVGPVPTHSEVAAVVWRDLHFMDRADGSVAVTDARTGETVLIALPGTNGFLRASMRGLASERKHEDIGAAVPFRLTEWADGRLTLKDPTTHRKIELEAFGQTNEEVFARMLPTSDQARSGRRP